VVSIIRNELKLGDKIALRMALFAIILGAYNVYETDRIVHCH